MTLIRWNPAYRTLDPTKFHHEVDRLFESVLARKADPTAAVNAPAVDVAESPAGFQFHVDLPGFKREDLKVTLEHDVLTISGERKPLEPSPQGAVQLAERRFGTFERQFTFQTPVRSDAVEARYRDGVLEVNVPKAEHAKAREIPVQVS